MAAYVTIVLAGNEEARSRIEARMSRLLLTDPDLCGATFEVVRGEGISVECRDEIVAAQILRVVIAELP